jgi:hypothetical protein
VGDEDDKCVSSKELHTMMKAMTGLFMKNRYSTETTLDQVERSNARVIDRVDALETRLPPADQVKLAKETHEDDYEEEDDKNDDDEPFNPPRPPPRWPHCDN